jgi:anti-anti-sigma factor
MLTYDLKVDPETISIDLKGNIDARSAELFENGLFIIADHENRSFFLHFENVEIVDSKGLECIIKMIRKVKAKGNPIYIANMDSDIRLLLMKKWIEESTEQEVFSF